MTTRRLAAILAADVVGFSAMVERDEQGTLAQIKALQAEVVRPTVKKHHGRVVKTSGDGFLVDFASPLEAVRCAIAIQEMLAAGPLQIRVGINLGDVVIEPDGDVYGDGVNIAARLESLCDPGGVLVSGKVFDEIEGKIDRHFESRGEHQVKNISRPVRLYALATDDSGRAISERKPLPLPDKPSIAVLPFENLSSDHNHDFIADGIAEDITAALSRLRSFFVIARNSTATYGKQRVQVQQISRELGVRYVVEGSLRRAGNRVRIAARLIDATSAAHLWADHYDGSIEEVFDLQDRITTQVAGAIQPSIRMAEIERAKRKRPDNLGAYDLVMRALPLVWSLERNGNRAATQLLQQALQLDPTYPTALALSAWCSGQRVLYNWSEDAASEKDETLRVAQQAASLSSDDAFVLAVLGAALSLALEFRRAEAMLERALAIDPSSAFAWSRSGGLKTYAGDSVTAIQHFEQALRLSPFDPMVSNWHFGIGCAHFVAGRYADSVAWQEKAMFANPAAVWMYRGLIPAYVCAGDMEKARAGLQDLLHAYPHLTLSTVRGALSFTQDYTERMIEGLRRAGLPE